MAIKGSRFGRPGGAKPSEEEMDRIVSQARQAQDDRMKGYRERSLKIHPWVCARCGREFANRNLHLLTVHHKDHNHDYNPPDGSNWENLCIYCHDNEHSRYEDHVAGEGAGIGDEKTGPATHKPFAALADLLKDRKE
jgi:5-methylcytosine-specific restriction endonuclease McrA